MSPSRASAAGTAALALLYLACGEPREPDGLGSSGRGAFDDGDVVGPGVREVQGFTLPTRAALSRQSFVSTDPFEHLRFDDGVAMLEAEGRIFVAERSGRIYAFEPVPGVREKTLVLDLSAHVVAARDSGLVAFALHPRFSEAGAAHRYLYAYYAHHDDPAELLSSGGAVHQARLSRFSIPEGELVADPSSELVLIEQRDRSLLHQGGGLLFNPSDGFLYLSIGDEGGFDCARKTCQHDDLFFGAVLRIDVDMRGGDVSHPIRRRPPGAETDHYFIPSDNPFVDEPGAMEELYAIGLRNPFRMTHDPVDHLTWISDVGQEQHDEINLLERGANYQWDMREGYAPAVLPSDPTRPRLGVWTDPLVAYERSEMRAIVGGLVYRGTRLPSLYGRYLHADFVRGNVWATSYTIESGAVEVYDTRIILETGLYDAEGGITSMLQTASGAVYMTSFGAQRGILGLEEMPLVASDAPTRLSQTGLFDDLATLTPAEGLRAYAIVAPLWSDGAHKQRFVAIPRGQRAHYEQHGPFRLPESTVLVKHFALALDERRPEQLHRLETRVLVVEAGGVYGATYKWRPDQSDADLLLEHDEEELLITGEDGQTRAQPYAYPSPAECLRCHRQEQPAGLGLSTAQLNRPLDGVNQLAAWQASGLLEGAPDDLSDPATLAALPRHAALDDMSAPLEQRVRSYLDSNCSHCHGRGELHGARWDARSETPLEAANILDAPLNGASQDPHLRIVAPGEPAHSQLYLRATSPDADRRMPPLATSRPDPAFAGVLVEWIDSLETEDDDGIADELD